MLRNYFKVAFRALRRERVYSSINVTGLAIGLAACLIILAYVQFERSFDRFHSKADRIYRLEMDVPSGDGVSRWGAAVQPLGAILLNDSPEVEAVTQISIEEEPLVVFGDLQLYESHFRYGDASFFDVFDFQILQGSKESLSQPGMIFLAESTAKKYFGNEEPVGQVIEVTDKWLRNTISYEVAGLLADSPSNSHFRVNLLASVSSTDVGVTDFWSRTRYTYVLLDEQNQIENLSQSLIAIQENHLDSRINDAELALEPLTSIHLYSKAVNDIEPQSDVTYVMLFSAIALLILVLACINYINLTTARSAIRVREIGVRKAVGANRKQLFGQFMGESFLYILIALVLGLGLAHLAIPFVSQVMNREFSMQLASPQFWIWVLAGIVLFTFLAGSYPALLLSSFNPSSILKSLIRTRSGTMVRRGLVVFQFAASIGFIAVTIIIYRQLDYVQQQRLGFDKEHKLVIMTRNVLDDQANTFKQVLLDHAAVQGVTMSSSVPTKLTAISFFSPEDVEDFDQENGFLMVDRFRVDHDFVDVLGINVVKGRAFDRNFSSDQDAILLNEAAIEVLGWDDPIGKRIKIEGTHKTVIGVLGDFQVQSVRQHIDPMLLELDASSRYIIVDMDGSDLPGTIASMQEAWDSFVPQAPFLYSFLEEDIEAMYRTERQTGQLFIYFTMLTVLVACLGLFGLAAYTAMQRTKEIGIRKTLGANTASLVQLLSVEYLKLLAIAYLFACPIAYFAINHWLDGFAYRVELSAWIFIAAGVSAAIITLFSSGYHSIKVALANPIDALRYE